MVVLLSVRMGTLPTMRVMDAGIEARIAKSVFAVQDEWDHPREEAMSLELRQLRYFLAVSDEMHFGRAAARLHVQQSVVSEQIRRLERELGVELFDRSRRSITVTEHGSRLMPHIRRIVEDCDELPFLAESSSDSDHRLRIGVGLGMGRRLPSILRRLAESGYSTTTVYAAPAERCRMVDAGELDAALVRGRVRNSAVAAHHVWNDRMEVALAASHPLAGRDELELRDLAEYPVALGPEDGNPALHATLLGAMAAEGLTPRRGIPFTSPEVTFAEMVAHAHNTWTVMYQEFEATQGYEGIVSSRLAKPITLAAFLVTAKRDSPRHQVILDACRRSRVERRPAGADEI
ncbi:LysR family transcriptional regulator [Tsukamurella sp. TY48]|nr:LysR family transcriptional regulator [Tsukamurella sp. TY48]